MLNFLQHAGIPESQTFTGTYLFKFIYLENNLCFASFSEDNVLLYFTEWCAPNIMFLYQCFQSTSPKAIFPKMKL